MNMEKIRKLFSDDSYLLQNVILELNSWYGVFEDLMIHEHDSSFYETYFPDPYEAIKSFYFGPDSNNIYHDFCRIDSLGNIETFPDERSVHEFLIQYINDILDELEYRSDNSRFIKILPDIIQNLIREDEEE